jgi:hypothetical protein
LPVLAPLHSLVLQNLFLKVLYDGNAGKELYEKHPELFDGY